ncbi:MAG: histidine phosphatase family protein [Acidobacteria bacterium]|nr:histidine phosphatase family protein [Acidobacteriota bacterium]MCH8128363.1 histidine phosphatase family protein [Acidobacteriota bacterium]MCH8900509.1 histidine phosphatase family protein [Acidobacteriota bacterium]
MHRLILFRHGKSDWDASYGNDRQRPLNKRGERAAGTMGIVLRQMGEAPDRIVSSTAVRAESTAEIARLAGGWSGPLELSDDLYGASPDEVLAVAARHGGSAQRLMLIGHEPAWSMVTTQLTGGRVAVPTGSVVGIDLDIDDWSQTAPASGTVAYALHPRMFKGWDL